MGYQGVCAEYVNWQSGLTPALVGVMSPEELFKRNKE